MLSCFHANLFFLTSKSINFLINSFDNDDMKSSKRHVVLVSLIFSFTAVNTRAAKSNLDLQMNRIMKRIAFNA